MKGFLYCKNKEQPPPNYKRITLTSQISDIKDDQYPTFTTKISNRIYSFYENSKPLKNQDILSFKRIQKANNPPRNLDN